LSCASYQSKTSPAVSAVSMPTRKPVPLSDLLEIPVAIVPFSYTGMSSGKPSGSLPSVDAVSPPPAPLMDTELFDSSTLTPVADSTALLAACSAICAHPLAITANVRSATTAMSAMVLLDITPPSISWTDASPGRPRRSMPHGTGPQTGWDASCESARPRTRARVRVR
jgi:hypothetical protein